MNRKSKNLKLSFKSNVIKNLSLDCWYLSLIDFWYLSFKKYNHCKYEF